MSGPVISFRILWYDGRLVSKSLRRFSESSSLPLSLSLFVSVALNWFDTVCGSGLICKKNKHNIQLANDFGISIIRAEMDQMKSLIFFKEEKQQNTELMMSSSEFITNLHLDAGCCVYDWVSFIHIQDAAFPQ